MKKHILSFLFTISFSILFAQDDPLAILNGLQDKPTHEAVTSTFKTTRVIMSQSVETVKKYNLDYRISHRFGDAGGVAGGIGTLYGFDNVTDARNALEYGVTDRFTVGIGRSSGGLVDGLFKYRLMVQTTDNHIPVSITLFHSTTLNTKPKIIGDAQYDSYYNRYSYLYQIIAAKKISRILSLEVLPSFVHRNYVSDPSDENDIFAVGLAGRIKITPRFALIADYYYVGSKIRDFNQNTYFMPLGLGIEIETGGHVFTINFTNAQKVVENIFLTETRSSWLDGQFRFGFTISRPFKLFHSSTKGDKVTDY